MMLGVCVEGVPEVTSEQGSVMGGSREESIPREQQPGSPRGLGNTKVLQEVQKKQEEESLKWQALQSPLRLCPPPEVYGSS